MKIRTIWILLLISTTAAAQTAFRRADYPLVAGDKIDTADFNRDGYMDVIAVNWQGVTILFGAEGGVLSQRIDIPGAGALDVVTGDFNGDGNPDFAVITRFFWGAGSKVAVFVGNGHGTFAAPVEYFVGNNPSSIVAADFNNDGLLDLATTDEDSGTVSLLLGNGDGTFQPARSIPTLTDNPFFLRAASFSGDQLSGLLVHNGGSLSVFRSNASGDFVRRDFAGPGSYFQLGVGDFDGDGITDLALAYTPSRFCAYECPISSKLMVWLGRRDGGFDRLSAIDLWIGKDPRIAVADFDGDGVLDLAIFLFSRWTDSPLGILKGNGDGTFRGGGIGGSPGLLAGLTGISSVIVRDLDGDGKPDLIVSGSTSSGAVLVVLLNTSH